MVRLMMTLLLFILPAFATDPSQAEPQPTPVVKPQGIHSLRTTDNTKAFFEGKPCRWEDLPYYGIWISSYDYAEGVYELSEIHFHYRSKGQVPLDP